MKSPNIPLRNVANVALSYEAPLKVVVRLVFYDVAVDKDGNEQRTVSSIKEQEVYLGNIPLMARLDLLFITALNE